MHEVLVNRLGGLSLPRKSVVRLTDRPDMTLDVYRGRKTTIQPNKKYAFTRSISLYVCCATRSKERMSIVEPVLKNEQLVLNVCFFVMYLLFTLLNFINIVNIYFDK